MKDFVIVCGILLLIVIGFYAFQILVLAMVGLFIYWALPIVKQFLHRRPKWK